MPGTQPVGTAVSGATTRLDLTDLDTVVQELFAAGIAPSTRRVYQSGTRRYIPIHVQNVPDHQTISCIATDPEILCSVLTQRQDFTGHSKELLIRPTAFPDSTRLGGPTHRGDGAARVCA